MIDDARTQIVNDALFWLGNEPVPDLSDASLAASVAAVKLLRVIERARDVVLVRHGWTCALEYASLSPAAIANYNPPASYPTVFLLPADALRVWSVEGAATTSEIWQGWEPRWQVGTTEADGATRLILRGSAPVFWNGLDGAGLVYQFGLGWSSAPSSSDAAAATTTTVAGGLSGVDIAYMRRSDWASLDPHVADAVAMELAARGAFSVTGDRPLAMGLKQQADQATLLAIGAEANHEGGQPPLGASIPAALRSLSR
jgi:hypothetical protein